MSLLRGNCVLAGLHLAMTSPKWELESKPLVRLPACPWASSLVTSSFLCPLPLPYWDVDEDQLWIAWNSWKAITSYINLRYFLSLCQIFERISGSQAGFSKHADVNCICSSSHCWKKKKIHRLNSLCPFPSLPLVHSPHINSTYTLENLTISPKWWLLMGIMQHFTRGEQGLVTGMIEAGRNRLFRGIKFCSGHY